MPSCKPLAPATGLVSSSHYNSTSKSSPSDETWQRDKGCKSCQIQANWDFELRSNRQERPAFQALPLSITRLARPPNADPNIPPFLLLSRCSSLIGGKGTPRRKVQAKKGAAGEDKKLQAALKKLNVQPVTGIEEVNMFKEDGNVLHFKQPKGELHTYTGGNTTWEDRARGRSGSPGFGIGSWTNSRDD